MTPATPGKIFRQQGVQIEKGKGVEADFLGMFGEHLDRRLVVEDHLNFALILAIGSLS